MPTWEVIHGDCLKVLPTLAGIDAVITDPPYGVDLEAVVTKHRRVPAKYATTNDSEDEVLRIVHGALAECFRIADRTVVMPGNRLMQRYPVASDVGAVFFPNGAGIGPWGFICSHPILYYGKCPYLAKGMGSRPNGVSATHWNRRKDPEHPCEKPIQMMKWLVNRGSLPGDTVLDPFCGSGTTGVACMETGRNFIGIEIDAGYCEIARKRIGAAAKQGRLELTA